MDTSKLCRSCMKEVASWEKENFDQRAVDMFCYCTNIKISEDDKLPKQFCYDCTIRIESSYTFISEAQKFDATLKNIVSRTNTSIIVEIESQKNLTFTEYDPSVISDNLDSPYFNEILNNTSNMVANNEVVSTDTCDKPYEISFYNTIPTDNMSHNIVDVDKSKGNEIINNNYELTPAEENIVEKKHICALCNKSFATKVWYTKHMQKEHAYNQYICAQCGKTFTKQQFLTQHIVLHSEERLHSCKMCTKSYKKRKQLTIHMKTHSDARPYVCGECNMCFKLKSVLRSHMKLHEGDKQYLCYLCGWSFAQAGNLSVHMRTHSGEKPYKCGECPFACSVASSLRRHERRHRGHKRFLCKSCHKAFYDASGLARHARTHTGELPYRCPQCGLAFLDSWKRKTHLMRQHRLALRDIPRMRRDGAALPSGSRDRTTGYL